MKKKSGVAGGVMLELALTLTLFVPMLLGAIHFGYLFYLYNGLEKSVRDGARYAAGRTYVQYGPKAADPGLPSYQEVVKAVVVCGSWAATNDVSTCGVQGGAPATVSGLTTNMVVVTPIPNVTGVRPTRVRIAIQGYEYRGVLSGLLDTDGVLRLNKPSLEMPFFGRYAYVE